MKDISHPEAQLSTENGWGSNAGRCTLRNVSKEPMFKHFPGMLTSIEQHSEIELIPVNFTVFLIISVFILQFEGGVFMKVVHNRW